MIKGAAPTDEQGLDRALDSDTTDDVEPDDERDLVGRRAAMHEQRTRDLEEPASEDDPDEGFVPL